MLTGIFTKNSKSEASNQQLNDYNSSESSCNNDQIPNQGQQFRSNINLAKDRQTAKPRSEADLKNQRILLFKIASGLMMYPIHRAVYTLLKAYDQVMRRLGY